MHIYTKEINPCKTTESYSSIETLYPLDGMNRFTAKNVCIFIIIIYLLDPKNPKNDNIIVFGFSRPHALAHDFLSMGNSHKHSEH